MTLSIVALSGSLRKKSTHTRLLQEVGHLAGPDVSFALFDGLEDLPAFNPDRSSSTSAQAEKWIALVRHADVLMVSSPEYAHGIPGALKNALDWLVGEDAFIEKPFCLYRACPRPVFAPAALMEVLRTMSGRHVAGADVTINLRRDYDIAGDVLATEESRALIRDSIAQLINDIKARERT